MTALISQIKTSLLVLWTSQTILICFLIHHEKRQYVIRHVQPNQCKKSLLNSSVKQRVDTYVVTFVYSFWGKKERMINPFVVTHCLKSNKAL